MNTALRAEETKATVSRSWGECNYTRKIVYRILCFIAEMKQSELTNNNINYIINLEVNYLEVNCLEVGYAGNFYWTRKRIS